MSEVGVAPGRRLRAAACAALWHLLGSLLVAALAAVLVLGVWYPAPYGVLSGGQSLFLLLVGVDVVCGPLLTLVLFNPRKPRRELLTDLALVVLVQLAALGYGLHTAFQARPLFLVHEIERFRVITLPDYLGEVAAADLQQLPPGLRPRWWGGPVTVGIRPPASDQERNDVLLESVAGGRDYAQRPDFYQAYDAPYALGATARARPLPRFVAHFPAQSEGAMKLLAKSGVAMNEALFLPVMHRQEWVAVLSPQGTLLGFLPGSGFDVPPQPPVGR